MKFKENEEKKPDGNIKDAHKKIDELIMQGISPSEQQRLRDNRKFIKEISDKPLPRGKDKIRVFGVQDVNINAILKDNIWNRGIFTTDHLCRVVFQLRYEQIRKWLSQKRKKPFEAWLLILIIVGAAIALVVVLLLMNINFANIHF